MTPKHGPWRAHVVLHDVAEQQIGDMNDEAREVLDKAIVRLSLDHRIGTQTEGKLEWEYRDERVRILYIPTVIGTIILVAYVEVD
ncbi:hypothetical protein [Streptomyces hydrogenans]|uniref:hypothetical protein n=1 Tax=Streptomyces hydrogenans TaxID=1873719 RepID=UPI00380B2E8E